MKKIELVLFSKLVFPVKIDHKSWVVHADLDWNFCFVLENLQVEMCCQIPIILLVGLYYKIVLDSLSFLSIKASAELLF